VFGAITDHEIRAEEIYEVDKTGVRMPARMLDDHGPSGA